MGNPTLLAFNELPEGAQIGIATTDRGTISGQAVLQSALGGVVSFSTVARASSNRMLDAPLSLVQTWVDGQPLYTSSFGGAAWHWQADFPAATATDNETTCRPTSWIAGGLNGAAVRSVSGNLASLAQSWHVKKSVADNEGAGTALDPVQTPEEIQRRWGPSPDLTVADVFITFDEAPTSLALTANVVSGSHLGLVGTPTTTLANVTITAVQAQVRTAGAEAPHAITGVGLDAAHVGKIAIIRQSATPGHIGANAKILADLGGGKVMVTAFGTDVVDMFGSHVEITPLVGDVVDVMTSMTIPVTALRFYSKTNQFDSYAPNVPASNVVTTEWITFDGLGPYFNPLGVIELYGLCAFYFRGNLKDMTLSGIVNVDGTNHVISSGVDGFIYSIASTIFAKCGVGPGATVILLDGFNEFDTDTYFQNSTVIVDAGFNESFGAAYWNNATSFACLTVRQGSFSQFQSVPDWGTNNNGHALRMFSAAQYVYQTKPTVNGSLGAGREALIGGTDKTYAAVPYVETTNLAALVLLA